MSNNQSKIFNICVIATSACDRVVAHVCGVLTLVLAGVVVHDVTRHGVLAPVLAGLFEA